jgi:hypothetical protein
MPINIELIPKRALQLVSEVPARISSSVAHRVYLEAHGDHIAKLPIGGRQVLEDLELFRDLSDESFALSFSMSQQDEVIDPRALLKLTRQGEFQKKDPVLRKMVLDALPITMEDLLLAGELPEFYMTPIIAATYQHLRKLAWVSFQTLGHPMAAFMNETGYALTHWDREPSAETVWFKTKQYAGAALDMVGTRVDIADKMSYLRAAHFFAAAGMVANEMTNPRVIS